MAVFSLAPLDRFAGSKTTIKKPKVRRFEEVRANRETDAKQEVAFFSYDSNHQLLPFSNVSLNYYYPPFFDSPHAGSRRPIDLSRGFNTFRGRSDSPNEHLDGLLDTLVEAEKRQGSKLDADLITWRGMMTKILTSAYDFEDGFEMNATLFQGTIFIEENHEYKLAQKAKQSRQRSRGPGDIAMFWGYKFETLSMLSQPWSESSRDEIEGRQDKIVDNYAQYCSLIRTGIGSTSMILAGEIDGVLGYKPQDDNEPARWIELKTARSPQSQRDREIHDKKLLKFWAQSFLLGVPTIVIGYRDRDGYLQEIEEMATQRIPNQVQQFGVFKWNGNTCISSTAYFMEFLKATVTGEGVWRIRRRPAAPEIEVFKMEETGTGDILKIEFVEWRNRLLSKDVMAKLANGAATPGLD